MHRLDKEINDLIDSVSLASVSPPDSKVTSDELRIGVLNDDLKKVFAAWEKAKAIEGVKQSELMTVKTEVRDRKTREYLRALKERDLSELISNFLRAKLYSGIWFDYPDHYKKIPRVCNEWVVVVSKFSSHYARL